MAPDISNNLEMPAMVILGKQDRILIGEKQIPLLKESQNIMDIDIHLLAFSTHFIQEEEPEKIAEWIAKFVTK